MKDLLTWAGHDAHVPNCAYKDNPLPEPKEAGGKVENDGLDSMKMNELKAMAEEMGIEGASKMKKAELDRSNPKPGLKPRRPQSITEEELEE